MICENCKNEIRDNYCSACGPVAEIERINARYLASEFREVLLLEKGIFHTIKELLIRPGKIVRRFILKDRSGIVKPLIFLIVTSLAYTAINHYFPFEEGYVNYEGMQQSYTAIMFQWITQNYGYSNLIMGVFIGFWLQIFFKRYRYNFFEILVLICFVMGMSMLILGIFGLLESLSGVPLLQWGSVILMIYISWAIGQFFENKIGNYMKALAAYLIGALTFIILIIVCGTVLDVHLWNRNY